MAGRKPLFDLDCLKIGDTIELKGSKKKYAFQYAYNFKRRTGHYFAVVEEGNKVFLKKGLLLN